MRTLLAPALLLVTFAPAADAADRPAGPGPVVQAPAAPAAGPAAPGTTAPAATPGPAAPRGTPPAQLLVGVRPGVGPAQAEALWTPLGGRLVERLPQLDVYVIAVPPGRADEITRALQARPEVAFVEPNRKHAPAPSGGGTPARK